MIPSEIAQSVLCLSEEQRLELAGLLVASVPLEVGTDAQMADGVRRIEEVASGKVIPLTEEQFRAALR